MKATGLLSALGAVIVLVALGIGCVERKADQQSAEMREAASNERKAEQRLAETREAASDGRKAEQAPAKVWKAAPDVAEFVKIWSDAAGECPNTRPTTNDLVIHECNVPGWESVTYRAGLANPRERRAILAEAGSACSPTHFADKFGLSPRGQEPPGYSHWYVLRAGPLREVWLRVIGQRNGTCNIMLATTAYVIERDDMP